MPYERILVDRNQRNAVAAPVTRETITLDTVKNLVLYVNEGSMPWIHQIAEPATSAEMIHELHTGRRALPIATGIAMSAVNTAAEHPLSGYIALGVDHPTITCGNGIGRKTFGAPAAHVNHPSRNDARMMPP